MKIELIDPKKLKAHPRNPKRHTISQINHIKASIAKFGWVQPIVVDEKNVILVGHGRWEAAGSAEVPILKLKGLTESQKLALMVFDNTSNLETGFDPALMTEIVELLKVAGFPLSDMGFTPEVLGESMGERKQDENKLKESYERYINGEVKRLVLYFEPSELDDVTERIEAVMELDEIRTKSDLVKAMILEFEKEYGAL
jgi:hypothetical protein